MANLQFNTPSVSTEAPSVEALQAQVAALQAALAAMATSAPEAPAKGTLVLGKAETQAQGGHDTPRSLWKSGAYYALDEHEDGWLLVGRTVDPIKVNGPKGSTHTHPKGSGVWLLPNKGPAGFMAQVWSSGGGRVWRSTLKLDSPIETVAPEEVVEAPSKAEKQAEKGEVAAANGENLQLVKGPNGFIFETKSGGGKPMKVVLFAGNQLSDTAFAKVRATGRFCSVVKSRSIPYRGAQANGKATNLAEALGLHVQDGVPMVQGTQVAALTFSGKADDAKIMALVESLPKS